MPKAASEARKVIADNLRALMNRPGRQAETERALAERAAARGHEISQSSINRVLNCEVSCGVDHLVILAKLYELEAWQLLVPQLNPTDPPVLTSITRSLAEFQSKLSEQADALAAMQRQLTEGRRQ